MVARRRCCLGDKSRLEVLSGGHHPRVTTGSSIIRKTGVSYTLSAISMNTESDWIKHADGMPAQLITIEPNKGKDNVGPNDPMSDVLLPRRAGLRTLHVPRR
jgi:hypothetical protein